jgi:hypothetical protein
VTTERGTSMQANKGKTSKNGQSDSDVRGAAASLRASAEVVAPACLAYSEVARRMQQSVERVVPNDATVAVVSKGDSALLRLHGRQAWHFPQREDGVYAGFYPPDSQAAIEHLESLRKKGARYLVFPATALWWMEKYPDFARHLRTHHRVVLDDAAACMIISLSGDGSAARETYVDVPVESERSPLFDAAYYLRNNPEVAASRQDPLAHYMSRGCTEGLYISEIHRNLVDQLLNECPRRHLLRGQWCSGIVLLFADGKELAETQRVLELAEGLRTTYHLRPLIVFLHRQGLNDDGALRGNGIVLEDVRLACDILRPSALHLLVTSLAALKPLFAIASTSAVTDALKSADVPFVLLADGKEESADASIDELLKRIRRDVKLPPQVLASHKKRSHAVRKIIIPCSDWDLSGVNSAIECIGRELISGGYDVEILFTQGEKPIADDPSRMPQIPFRHLQRQRPGVEAMWESLIAEVEMSAPCIVLTAYDFAANSIAPALGNNVGVVAWVQSDEREYYEQAYRLGRYCNAVVAVSGHIKQQLNELNPSIGARTRVIHNSSIRANDIAATPRYSGNSLRLIYTGRLVQYQKRILDIVELSKSLDRLEVPYQITLAGDFCGKEDTESIFRTRASAHLADGRIVLAGRLNHKRILDELQKSNFFLLPSEFEGLPLSLIEAMARGCIPVVARMESGVPEVVEDGSNGLIMMGRDYDAWARRIVAQWRQPEKMDDLSDRARETVRRQFTVEQIGAQFAELCEQIGRELTSGEYQRPRCLNWGEKHWPTGDVLPPGPLLTLLGRYWESSGSFLHSDRAR